LNASHLPQNDHPYIVVELDFARLPHTSANLAPPHHAGGVSGACRIPGIRIHCTHGSLGEAGEDG